MNVLRPMSIVALLIPVALIGCSKRYARQDSARPLPAPEILDRQPYTPQPPIPPPQPPVEPAVSPPKPEALSGTIPPIPNRLNTNPPSAIPIPSGDAPALVIPTSTQIDEGLDAEGDRRPLRERLEERRQDRQERRDQRQNPVVPPTPKPLSPVAPPDRPPPPVQVPDSAPAPVKTADELSTIRQLHKASVRQFEQITDFEARLIKQEVVKGKQMPRDEILFRFRKEPLSVYMKILSEQGHGREVLYVRGQHGNKMHVITGKGDNRLVGAGYKTTMDPDDKQVLEKSRYRVYEAGFGRTLTCLEKAIATVGTKGGCSLKYLGPVARKESPDPLEGVEISTRNAGTDSLIPGGGSRLIFFDPRPESVSFMLPILVITYDLEGREIEYYSFDRFRLPLKSTDADWNPARLGK